MKAVLLVVAVVLAGSAWGQSGNLSGGSGTVTMSGTPSFSNSSRCDSHVSSQEGWKGIASAPRDGTVVETAETYGIAVWYGLFKYVKGHWQDASNPDRGVSEDNCLFWRPYKGNAAKYKDPTGGKQDSVKYWCEAMHRAYDPKKDACK